MKSKDFLKQKLNELHERFKNLSIKYQYNAYSNMHIVEVLPLSEYKKNECYLDMESDLSYEFDNKFFPESVLFVSSDSLTKISDPEFTIYPETTKESFTYFNFNISNLCCNVEINKTETQKTPSFSHSVESVLNVSFVGNGFEKVENIEHEYSLAA